MRIVCGDDSTILQRITEEDVCAAIFSPKDVPWWYEELEAAVGAGALRIARTFVEAAEADALLDCVKTVWPAGAVSARVQRAVEDDIAELVARTQFLCEQTMLRLRIFAEPPDRRFGFHVDLATCVPTRSLLRVYAGPGTEYVDPSEVRTMLGFYRYVEQRELLAQDLPYGDERLAALDDDPPFVRSPAPIRVTPPASIVAIEHVREAYLAPFDVLSGRADGWVHRSPSTGRARFVVTITAKD